MSQAAKNTSDKILRAIACQKTIRIVIARTSETVESLRVTHDAGPVGTIALGRAATAALLLSTMLKDRQQVGVQINGKGPLGELYAIADWSGRIRATVANPQVDLGADGGLDVSKAIGDGHLSVVKGLSEDAPYRGVVPLVTGQIGDDVAHYLLTSEQIHSAVALGERFNTEGVEAAGGFFIQALPGADDADVLKVIDRLNALPPIADCFRDGHDPEDLLERLADDAEILDQKAIDFTCPCTREEFARRLCMLGEDDLKQLTDELEVVDTQCHFCRTIYSFDREQVNALLYGARMYDQAD